MSMEHGLAFLEGPLLLPRTIRSTSHRGATTTGFDHEPALRYFLEALDCSEEEVVGEIGEALSVVASGGVEGGKDGDGDTDGKGRRQGLGLGRKRAKFSMMPSKSSQESSDVNLSSKVDHIADPDEYFAALERNDFAEKELKKLRGDVAVDLKTDNVFRSKRQRRPGLLGRRTSLKHFSQELVDYGKTLLLSHEVNASKSSSPLKSATHKKYNGHADYNSLSSISQVMETVGSQLSVANEQEGFVADKENRADNIIDKLLSSTEVLHDQDGVALLQECLQFKTMVVDKIQLPVTPDTSPDTQAATSVRRNPLAAMSFLQKQNLQSDTLTDPYRWLSDDAPCAGEPSSLVRNEVAVACPDRTDTTQRSSPAISMNDTCTPSRQSGSKLNLEEILKSPSTLGLSINNNFTPPGKRGSNLSFSRTLESSNTEGGGEIFLDECPTDTFPSSIVKSAEDKKHLPVVANTQMLTSLSRNVLVASPISQKQILLADALAQSSESPTDDRSCAREPTAATKNEFTYANSHHDNVMQPTILVTSMNDTSAPSIKNGSMTGSEEILRSPITLALGVNDPSTPRGSKLSFGRILKSPTIEEHNNSCGKISLDERASNTSCRSIHKSTEKVSRRFDHDSGVGSIGFQCPSKEKGDDTRVEAATQKQPGTSLERLHSETLNPVETDGLVGTFSGCVVGDVDANPQNVDEALHEEHELTDLEDQSRSALGTTAIVSGQTESSGILGEQHNEENQTTSRVPNGMAPHQSKRRKSRGKSLAGDGTRFVAGVRRSSRERFRPLEHWRGERLLYGRIHQSLATVIGVKYSSPGGNKLKVKSIVSQEYSELVERAAMH